MALGFHSFKTLIKFIQPLYHTLGQADPEGFSNRTHIAMIALGICVNRAVALAYALFRLNFPIQSSEQNLLHAHLILSNSVVF